MDEIKRPFSQYSILRLVRFMEEKEEVLREQLGPCVVDNCVLYFTHKGTCFDTENIIR